MIISDTIHYREDGTVSSVIRVTRSIYETPSGREATEDVSSEIALADVASGQLAAYGARESANAALENQVQTLRDDKEGLQNRLAAALSALRAVAAADSSWDTSPRSEVAAVLQAES